jgi:hypothetical protein
MSLASIIASLVSHKEMTSSREILYSLTRKLCCQSSWWESAHRRHPTTLLLLGIAVGETSLVTARLISGVMRYSASRKC